MINGLLWFDNSDKRTLHEKLLRAKIHYHDKFKQWPTTCYVHPSTLVGEERVILGIELRPTNTVLPNHFWIGVQHES